MHIIGIRIYDGSSEVLKNLKPGWYPFGNYVEPTKDNGNKWKIDDDLSDELYQLYPGLPQISVSCIVGKNGSGKTTLLDILYRIINNLACEIYDRTIYSETYYRLYLEKADCPKARLYFETDGQVRSISIKSEGETTKKVDYDSFIKGFFYTIGVNYSIHSMKFSSWDKGNSNPTEWLKRIFQNKETYYVPLTLSPIRSEGGQINIVEEREKAKKRIISLAILLYAQDKKELINDCMPVRIEYKLNTNYKKKIIDDLEWKMTRTTPYLGITKGIIKEFVNVWASYVNKKYPYVGVKLKVYCLYALAYESAKLCFTYQSYGEILNVGRMNNSDNGSTNEIVRMGRYKDVINKILHKRGNDSLTLNIWQILSCLDSNHGLQNDIKVMIDDIINIPEDQQKSYTYDRIYLSLLPSFYECELYVKHKNEDKDFNLSELSSGELQLLYTHSDVLYHINNIVNAEEDTRVIPYKHINVVFDEVEMYAHPEFQRNYIASLIEKLSKFNYSSSQIRSINIIIATHSPFIISDVPCDNIMALKNGKACEITRQTFCANIYDLLRDPFFMESSIGETAKFHLEKIINAYNGPKELKQEIREKKDFYLFLKNKIGDDYLKDEITMMIDYIVENNN